MELKDRLRTDMADAMRSGDQHRRDLLRLMVAAVKQEEVDSRHSLSDDGVLSVLQRQAKQRRESIADAQSAGRADLVAQEEAELALIEQYLPQMMSRDEVRALAGQVIADLNAADMKSMGRVMGQLMPQLQGKAEGHVVSDVVRELLSGRP
jgi:uncharacterized protein